MSGSGELTTKQMTFDGDDLYLNANALNGSVTISLTDGVNTLNSKVITGDSVNHKVAWQNGDLSIFNGKAVTMTIRATNADIYSYTFK